MCFTERKLVATLRWSVPSLQRHLLTLSLCVTFLCYRIMDCTVHGILQARMLKWVAFPFSRGSPQPRDRTQVSHIAGRFSVRWATREAQLSRYFRLFSLLSYFLWWSLISDIWCWKRLLLKIDCNLPKAQLMVVLARKYLLMKVCTFFLHNAISHLIDYNIHIVIIDYNINITFICTGKPKLCDSFVRKFAFFAAV